MKKLILLLPIIAICYACQKQTIEPIVAKSSQLTYDLCADSGICSEGIYETGPTFTPGYDTIIHQIGSTTQFAQIKLTFNGYGSPVDLLDDTLTYKMTLLNVDTSYIKMSSIYILHEQRYRTKQVFTLKSKTGKYIIFKFKQL